MRCSQAMQQLQLYVDAQLAEEKIRPLEVHLTGCAECRSELAVMEEIAAALESTESVMEPPDLTRNIMQRVALDVQQREHEKLSREVYIPLRPSLKEILAAVGLATITMLCILLGQPTLRANLPFANVLNHFSQIIVSTLKLLASTNSGTLNAAFWILGTLLGVCITLALAGNEVREEWFKAISHKLPVW